MADNPLEDWLRERGAWPGDADTDATAPPTSLGAVASTAGAEAQAVGPSGPGQFATGEEDEPDWARDPEERPGRRRRLLLLGLAVVPWLGFAAVAAGALGGDQGGEAVTERAASVDDPTSDEDAPARPVGERSPDTAGAAQSAPTPVAPGTAPEPSAPPGGERLAGAAAALAVRTELTGPTPGEEEVLRYVDLAAPESVEWIGDVAIVAVAALVLEGTADEWSDARPARFAVPVRVLGGQAVPLGVPWTLPPPAPRADLDWEPVDDDALAGMVGDVLTDAGYRDPGELALARSPDVPGVLLAEVVAVAPGADLADSHRVWLRDGDPPSSFGTER